MKGKFSAGEVFIDRIKVETVERIEYRARLARVRLSEGLPRSGEDFLQLQRHLRLKLDEQVMREYKERVISVDPPLGIILSCKENELHKGEYDISATYFVSVEKKK
ncbi:MAG: hypothetical protein AABW58_01430 [Nanoarchaeota archaeon]